MGLIKKYMNQTRKPNGILGKMMLKGMNMGHAKLSDFGISTLPNKEFFNIAELGCGGGRNIDALLNKYSKARIVGVDYSPLSVEKAKEFNKKNMSRCEIKQGDVSKLDLPKNKFDLVTAFETIYFWPNIDKCFKNVFEILNDNGYFLIVNELEGEDKLDQQGQENTDRNPSPVLREQEEEAHKADQHHIQNIRYFFCFFKIHIKLQ